MKRIFRLKAYSKVAKPSAAARQMKYRLKKKAYLLEPGSSLNIKGPGLDVVVTNTGSQEIWLSS